MPLPPSIFLRFYEEFLKFSQFLFISCYLLVKTFFEVHGFNLFFSTLPCSCLACLPVVVFLSCCHDVLASRPLLVNELYCLVNWLSICQKFSCLGESRMTLEFMPTIQPSMHLDPP